MTHVEYRAYAEQVKERARGRWADVLAALGIERRYLVDKHGPCPLCSHDARDDRFRFSDRHGNGEYICSPNGHGCGAGDGLQLLMKYHGWDYCTAIRKVSEVLGWAGPIATQPCETASSGKLRALLQKTWDEARPVVAGDPVGRCLASRGLALTEYPKCLRFHPSLGYFVKDENKRAKLVSTHPAMLAKVTDPSGKPLTLHRTYLTTAGGKAPVEAQRKLFSSGIKAAAIRLFAADEELGVAEGIETALAAHELTGYPLWAALSSANLEAVVIPDTVRRLHIFADTDRRFAGQAAAFALARRYANGPTPKAFVAVYLVSYREGRHLVRVYRSADAKCDFADVCFEKMNRVA
jgi:putative DNA primase/helicase